MHWSAAGSLSVVFRSISSAINLVSQKQRCYERYMRLETLVRESVERMGRSRALDFPGIGVSLQFVQAKSHAAHVNEAG